MAGIGSTVDIYGNQDAVPGRESGSSAQVARLFNASYSQDALKAFKRAEQLRSSGQETESLNVLAGLLESGVDEDEAWQARLMRAKIYESRGSYQLAVHVFTEFIEIARPGILLALAYSHRADLYTLMGDRGRANLDRERVDSMR